MEQDQISDQIREIEQTLKNSESETSESFLFDIGEYIYSESFERWEAYFTTWDPPSGWVFYNLSCSFDSTSKFIVIFHTEEFHLSRQLAKSCIK
jgi:hypothetical protein